MWGFNSTIQNYSDIMGSSRQCVFTNLWETLRHCSITAHKASAALPYLAQTSK